MPQNAMLLSYIIQRVFNIWHRRSNQIYVKDDAIDKKQLYKKAWAHKGCQVQSINT